MEALRPKLVRHLESMMATVERAEADNVSGQIAHSSAGRIADAVLVVTRAHDEDYARTLELAAAFRRLPVQITVNEAKAPFADGYLDDESVAMLCAAAESDFAARQPDTGRGGDRAPEPDRVVPDPELAAMGAVLAALGRLRPDECSRVLDWARRRFAVDPPF